MMVCQRVEEKGTTTYNEVADELVQKVLAKREEKENGGGGKFDESNIRRRLYATAILIKQGFTNGKFDTGSISHRQLLVLSF